MYMYPKNARTVISLIIKNKLSIENIPKKYTQTIFEYGLHGTIPSKYYNDAINDDIGNIKYLPPSSVKLNDLIKLIDSNSYSIDEKLYSVLFLYRRDLIKIDTSFIKLMIDHNILTQDDIKFILDEKLVSVSYILKLDPLLASNYMNIDSCQLIDIVKNIDIDGIIYIYKNTKISLESLLLISDTYNIPPENISLMNLSNVSKAIDLINKYPISNVINNLSPKIKNDKNFIENLHKVVKNNFPNNIKNINNVIANNTDINKLKSLYGIKCVAMFNINMEDICDDIKSLSNIDINFIKNNINVYDTVNKNFSSKFREWCINNNQNINNNDEKEIYNTLRKKRLLHRNIKFSFRRSNTNNPTLERVITHIDSISKNNKISKSDIANMIAPFRFDPCVVRDVMLANGSLKTKQRILKSIMKWKIQTITPAHSINQLNSDIINDIISSISTTILQNYKFIYNKIESYGIISTIDSCLCNNCSMSMCVSLKSTNVNITDLSTDDELSSVLYDLVKHANHGLINHKIVNIVGWGPLSCIIKGDKNINVDLEKILYSENLLNGKITYTGNNLVKNLSNILFINTNDMISFKSVSLNNTYTKIVLLLNIILEYILTIMLYRLVHVKKIGMYSEFVFKILNTVLEASGVYYYQIQISDAIENELTELLLNGTMPIYTLYVFLQIVSVVLDRIIKK
ncbi:hypothetical protein COTV057 [Cotia virus SPAn232]|uniref:Uncharacterized protein n=2 Tax=Cotia virus TaxID=39444 RepID=H6TA34_9POXV|nr:hypothetical protein COTV057 [Cotia virus SPAn232]ADT91074.1 hypothetical protein COTV057 [Cotia virus SPAn232]AIT70672.1 hypothetical protein [Cotia virus]